MSEIRAPTDSSSGHASTIAQLVAALSLACDLGVGLPPEHCLRACYLGVQIAAELDLDPERRADVFWTLLLKDGGCTSFASQLAAFVQGDEIAARRQLLFSADAARLRDMLDWAATFVGARLAPWSRAGRMVDFMANGRDFFREGFQSATEVAQRISTRLEMRPEVGTALGALFERWDGKGMPRGLRGDAIPVVSRVAYASTYFEVFSHAGGPEAAAEIALARKGSAFDGAVVDAFLRASQRPGFWSPLQRESILEYVLSLRPSGPAAIAREPALDALAHAFADFVDLKSPYFAGHSRRVAALAIRLGQRLNFSSIERACLNRADLMHDVGLVGIPSFAVNQPPEDRSHPEHEAIRRHPLHVQTLLRAVPALATEQALIAAHHERPDGNGLQGLVWEEVPPGARVIAVADRYDELTHDQPGAPALAPERAIECVRGEAGFGLDPDVVRALVNEVGASSGSAPARSPRPASLTEREVEVLRLLGRGLNRRQVAQTLVISDATARHHLEHIYDKIGATTQVGAVLFAMEHGLLE